MLTGPASVSTCNAAPPASHNSWRQRPHGASGFARRAVDARERDEATTSARVQRRHQAALGAQREPVRRVLDVAAGDDAAVVDECGRTHLQVRVRRVRALRDLARGGPQVVPGDVHFDGS